MDDNKINCFLIGAQKSGTTTLYSWLSQHPEIDAPEALKDFHFFTSDEYFPKGYAWFENQYKEKNVSVRLNGAVNYILRPEVPEKIKNYNPEAKFIVVLRDPVKRAFSAYQFFKKLNREKLSFQEAIKREYDGKLNTWKEKDDYAYLLHGLYHEQLSKWLKVFDRKQFLFLIYEELFRAPETHLPKIFDFIKVNPDFKPTLETKNVSGEVKYKALNNLIYDDNSVLKRVFNKIGLKYLVPIEWRGRFLNKFRDLNTKKGSVSKKITQEEYDVLKGLFKDDSQKLSDFLDKDLTAYWKY